MKRLWIISPHIDDAVLSMGGTIHDFITKAFELQVVYVFSKSSWCNETIYSGPLSQDHVTTLRKAEEHRASALGRYDFTFLDFLDAPLREGYTVTQLKSMVEDIEQALRYIISPSDTVFFPLGLFHPDHILIREIGKVFHEQQYHILFYEDMPYMTDAGVDYASLCKDLRAMGLEKLTNRIDFAAKHRMLKQYKSQVSEDWIGGLKCYAYNPLDESYYERFWQPAKRNVNNNDLF